MKPIAKMKKISFFSKKDPEKSVVSKKKSSLSKKEIEDHILKQRALKYFSDGTSNIREVSELLKITVPRIKTFFEDEIFLTELNERIDQTQGIDTDFRLNQSKFSLVNLYKELKRRLVEEEVKEIPMRDLHRMIMDTQKELRLDTPGEFTSKVGVANLTDLQTRYHESLSGRQAAKKAAKSAQKET